jgi:N-acetylmuramoyl-L-alanine amidase
MNIVPRPGYGGDYPVGSMTNRTETKRIMLHCTANSGDVSFEQLYALHVGKNGWSDVGYHFLIRTDGTIQACRDISKVGAGCSGQNHDTIHIAYAGGILSDGSSIDNRTPQQIESMVWLIRHLATQYDDLDDPQDIVGHNQFAAKDCPCFNVPNWVDSVINEGAEPGNPEPGMPPVENLIQYIRDLELRIEHLENWRRS